MKVILLQDIPNLGSKYDIVIVKDGYARNFLIPKGLVIPASKSNIKHVEEIKRQKAAKIRKEIERAEELVKKLSKIKLKIRVRTGQEGKLFGSVGTQDILKTLHEKGFNQIEKGMVILKSPIKETGEYEIDLKLHPQVQTKIKVEIIPAEVVS